MPSDHVVLPYLLRQRAEETPDRPYLRRIDGEPRSLSDSAQAAWAWAGALRSLGVGAGDFVGSMMPNSSTSIELFFGINALGAVEVPVHNEYRGTFLSHVLNTAGVRAFVISRSFADRVYEVASDLTTLEALIITEAEDLPDGLPFKVFAADELQASTVPVEPVHGIRDRDICTVLFTSGTTGASKGVLIPYTHLRSSTDGAWPPEHFGPQDTNYLVLPLHHIAGKVAIDSMLLAGGQVAHRERFKTDAFWEDVRRNNATCACIMGAMAGFLMAAEAREDDADNPLDKILLLPLPPYVDEFRDRFGLRVHTIYNQTETSCPVMSDGYTTGHYTSCGQVRDGFECRIVDPDDQPVPVGEVGELVVRGDRPWTMMAGYIGMPDKTVEAWRNQWLHTGDAFKADAEGNYYFIDRMKDVIRRRGENISSVEVEDAVCRHPDVLECAAIPVPSEWTEEEVMIVVARNAGSTLTEPELGEYLTSTMPRFMVPRYIEFADELPKTPTQKVTKEGLRRAGLTERTWDREGARV